MWALFSTFFVTHFNAQQVKVKHHYHAQGFHSCKHLVICCLHFLVNVQACEQQTTAGYLCLDYFVEEFNMRYQMLPLIDSNTTHCNTCVITNYYEKILMENEHNLLFVIQCVYCLQSKKWVLFQNFLLIGWLILIVTTLHKIKNCS